MLKRIGYVLLLAFMAATLTGCVNTPEKLYKDGKYTEAYTEFVKRAGKNEVALTTEVTNSSSYSRHSYGNKAINDYYYAAQCQKNLGNDREANFYFQKVVSVSNYKIRTPHDEAKKLKDQYRRYQSAVRNYRHYQKQYVDDAAAYKDSHSSGGTGTDPYDDSGSETDPYAGSGSGTDPYGDYARGTDPYDSDYTPDMSALNSCYRTLLNEKDNFEEMLYRTSKDIVPAIDNIKDEYEWMDKYLDRYMEVASPYNIERNKFKSALISDDYDRFSSKANAYSRLIQNTETKITYTTEDLKITNLAQVREAQNFIGDHGSSPAQAPSTPTARVVSVVNEEFDAQITGNIKEADANMRAAYNNYKNLASDGAASASEVKLAAEEYRKAKKIYDALRKQQ